MSSTANSSTKALLRNFLEIAATKAMCAMAEKEDASTVFTELQACTVRYHAKESEHTRPLSACMSRAVGPVESTRIQA